MLSDELFTANAECRAPLEAVKTVSTIEREQLEVDFAKKVLWEMIDKGRMLCFLHARAHAGTG